MKILAMDCATACCSVALRSDGAVAAARAVAMERGHAETLVPMIEAVLDDAGAAYGDLDLLAVTTGPGAFTGLRIGLATARAIALAAGLPLIGITTLETLARQVRDRTEPGRTVLAVLDTKRGDFYAQAFGAGVALDEPQVMAGPELVAFVPGPLILVGDGAVAALEVLTQEGVDGVAAADILHPDAATVAVLAEERWTPGEALTSPVPLYLRAASTSRPKERRAARPGS